MDLAAALTIDDDAGEPPFEQLRNGVARLVSSGELIAGDRLPTVRGLAEDLGLAPNTVAKAYRALESDGLISTEGRRGTFVRSKLGESVTDDTAAVEAAAAELARLARRRGLTLPETQRLLERAWRV